MEAFKVGDEVQLKTGGPPMTVENVNSGNVSCIWFHGGEAKCQTFPAATLVRYTRPTYTPVVRRRKSIWGD
jgi:uncharacterized protein YodC (DUF2158 family)